MNQEIQKHGSMSLISTNRELTYNDSKKGTSIRDHIKNKCAPDMMRILSEVLMKMVKLYGWNVSTDWTPLMCEIIFDTYPSRSLEQIIYIMNLGMRGKYGELSYQFNPSILQKWIHIYDKNTNWN